MEYHRENKKKKYDIKIDSSIETPFSSSDESWLSDDNLIGNDSSDYNERAKFGGTYMLRNCMDNKNVQPNKTTERKFELQSPQDDFGATNSQERDKSQPSSSPGIKSQISKIGKMFESFVKNSQHELQVLSNLLESPTNSEKESVDDTESNKILNAELQSGDEEIEAEYSTSTIVTFPIKFDSLPNAQSMNPSNPDQIIVHAFNDDQLVNGSYVSNDLDKGNLNVASSSIVESVVTADEQVNSNAQDVTQQVNTPIDETFHTVPDGSHVPNDRIQLPMASIPEYDDNENILFEEDVEEELGANMPHSEGLVYALLSLTNEVEAKYMNRTIEKLFESTFFVDSVGWQTAEKRVNIKNTHLLRCWKKSFEKSFGPDDDNSRFMGHFRRYKSAKRASKKSEEKKKAKQSAEKRKNAKKNN